MERAMERPCLVQEEPLIYYHPLALAPYVGLGCLCPSFLGWRIMSALVREPQNMQSLQGLAVTGISHVPAAHNRTWSVAGTGQF